MVGCALGCALALAIVGPRGRLARDTAASLAPPLAAPALRAADDAPSVERFDIQLHNPTVALAHVQLGDASHAADAEVAVAVRPLGSRGAAWVWTPARRCVDGAVALPLFRLRVNHPHEARLYAAASGERLATREFRTGVTGVARFDDGPVSTVRGNFSVPLLTTLFAADNVTTHLAAADDGGAAAVMADDADAAVDDAAAAADDGDYVGPASGSDDDWSSSNATWIGLVTFDADGFVVWYWQAGTDLDVEFLVWDWLSEETPDGGGVDASGAASGLPTSHDVAVMVMVHDASDAWCEGACNSALLLATPYGNVTRAHFAQTCGASDEGEGSYDQLDHECAVDPRTRRVLSFEQHLWHSPRNVSMWLSDGEEDESEWFLTDVIVEWDAPADAQELTTLWRVTDLMCEGIASSSRDSTFSARRVLRAATTDETIFAYSLRARALPPLSQHARRGQDELVVDEGALGLLRRRHGRGARLVARELDQLRRERHAHRLAA